MFGRTVTHIDRELAMAAQAVAHADTHPDRWDLSIRGRAVIDRLLDERNATIGVPDVTVDTCPHCGTLLETIRHADATVCPHCDHTGGTHT